MSSTSNAVPGALRLKGRGVDKKKKKKRPKPNDATTPATHSNHAATMNELPATETGEVMKGEEGGKGEREKKEVERLEREIVEATRAGMSGRTEAERRYEERRRERMAERMRREGAKTHKEKVQELNRYLSGLSEHHDMPRIGPG